MSESGVTQSAAMSSASPSRRNVVKGAAWAVPVIATAVATPFAAASAGCLSNLATPGVYAPFSVNHMITEIPSPRREGIVSGSPHAIFAPNSVVKYISTFTYSGSLPLPAGGEIDVHVGIDASRDWQITVTGITSGAAYLGTPTAYPLPTDPYNTAMSQSESVVYPVLALPTGATIVIEWELTTSGSSNGTGVYGAVRTRFPNPCTGTPLIHRSIVGNGYNGVGGTFTHTLPTQATTVQPEIRFIVTNTWATQPTLNPQTYP